MRSRPLSRLEQEARDEIDGELLDATARLIERGVGIENLSYALLAEETGILQGTIAHHFPGGAEQLLEALYERIREEREFHYRELDKQISEKKLLSQIPRLFALFEENHRLMEIIAGSAGGNDDGFLRLRRRQVAGALRHRLDELPYRATRRALPLLYLFTSARAWMVLRAALGWPSPGAPLGRASGEAAVRGLREVIRALGKDFDDGRTVEALKRDDLRPTRLKAPEEFDGELTPRERRATVEVLQGSRRVLKQKGLLGLTIDEVARETGLTRQTLHRYQEVLEGLVPAAGGDAENADGEQPRPPKKGDRLREALLGAVAAWLYRQLGPEPAQPTREALGDWIKKAFARFSEEGEVVDAVLASRVARRVRLRGRNERMETVQALVARELSGRVLDQTTLDQTIALVYLLRSVSTWQVLRDASEEKLAAEEIAHVASWAIGVILEAAKRDSQPAPTPTPTPTPVRRVGRRRVAVGANASRQTAANAAGSGGP